MGHPKYKEHPVTHLIGDVNGDDKVTFEDGWTRDEIIEIYDYIGQHSEHPKEDQGKVKIPPRLDMNPWNGVLGDTDYDGVCDENDGWDEDALKYIKREQQIYDYEKNRYVNQKGFIQRAEYNWQPPIRSEVEHINVHRLLTDPQLEHGERYYRIHILYKPTEKAFANKIKHMLSKLCIRTMGQGDPTGHGNESLYINHTIKTKKTFNAILRQLRSIKIMNRVHISEAVY